MTQTLALSSEARHLQDWKTLFEFRISKPIVELKWNCKKEQAYYFLIGPKIVFRQLELIELRFQIAEVYDLFWQTYINDYNRNETAICIC